MKSFKELKKMDVFKKLLDDPGDTKNILAAKMAWQKLVMNEELPVELKKNNSLKGFVQDLLKIDVSFGLEMLKQEQEKQDQEKLLAEQQAQEQEEDQEEDSRTPATMSLSKEDIVPEESSNIKEMKLPDEEKQKIAAAILKDANLEVADLRKKAAGYDAAMQEISDLKKKLFTTEGKISALEEENAELKLQVAFVGDLQAQLAKVKEKPDVEKTQEIDQMKVTKAICAHQDELAAELQKKRSELMVAMENLENADFNNRGLVLQVSVHEKTIEDLKKEIATLRKDAPDSATEVLIEGFKKDKEELVKQLLEANEKLGSKEKELLTASKKVSDQENELKELQAELEETHEKLEEVRALAGSTQAQTQRLEKEAGDVKALKTNLFKAKKLIEKQEVDIAALKSEIDILKNDAPNAGKIKMLEDELEKETKKKDLLQKKVDTAAIQSGSHVEMLKEKDEEIRILEATIEKLRGEKEKFDTNVGYIKEGHEKTLKHVKSDAKLQADKIAKENVTLQKKVNKAPILGKFALIPPLFVLFFPFTPKKGWTGWRLLVHWPIALALNIACWVLVTYGGLNVTSHFIAPAEPKVKDVTDQAFGEIEKQAKNAGIYYSINSGAVNADPGDRISKALGEKDREFEEQLKLYILKTDIDSKYVLQTELEKYVLKTKAEADLKQALADNDASWTEKLKLYVLITEADAKLEKQKGAFDSQRASFKRQFDEQKKAAEDAALANKSLTEKAGKLETEAVALKQQIEAQKKAGTDPGKDYILKTELAKYVLKTDVNSKYVLKTELEKYILKTELANYVLKTEAEENLRLQILKRDGEWQKALDTVNGDLKAEKTKVSDLVNEKAVLKQTADLVPGLQQALAGYKVYDLAIKEIKIIRMDDAGFVSCPDDRPQDAVIWFVNSFKRGGKRVADKFSIGQEGLIAIHYSGINVIKEYKCTKYYLALKKTK